jgi:hypothetical protein
LDRVPRRYQGENVIKVGPNSYYGWPLGPKSFGGWKETLIAEYNRDLPEWKKIMTIAPTRFYNGWAKFFSVAIVGMDVFDLRTG